MPGGASTYGSARTEPEVVTSRLILRWRHSARSRQARPGSPCAVVSAARFHSAASGVPPNDPDRVLLERLQAAEKRAAEEAVLRQAAEKRAAEEAELRQAAEKRAAEEAELRQAEAVLRQAAEERATKEAEMRKKMEEAIGKARALEQATRWSSVATRASLFNEAKRDEVYTVDESLAMGDIPLLPVDVAHALAAAVEPFSVPPEDAPEESVNTNGSLHSTALALLLAVERCVGKACSLRRFYEQELERLASGQKGPKNRPDFTYTYRHEAEATLLSSLVIIELKTRRTRRKSATTLLDEGYVQCFRYGAARVLHLGDRFPDFARHEAVVVLSNLETLSVMRVVLTQDKFIAYASRDEPLLLLPSSRRSSSPQVHSLAPGVALLARVLCASPEQLGGVLANPPETLNVQLSTHAQRQQPAGDALITIGDLLGRGGFCDVFAGTSSSDGARCVVKLPRMILGQQRDAAASSRAYKLLRREATVLRKLACVSSPHVPVLLGAAFQRDAPHIPALVMQPVGVVATKAPGASSPPGSRERRELAQACAVGVFAALREAHKVKVLHTDVRPTNVILDTSTGIAVLADWGIARSARASLRGLQPAALGWPDCAPDDALRASAGTGPPWLPCRGTDCESAVYALAALAFGDPCGDAPWSRNAVRDAEKRVAEAAQAITDSTDEEVVQRAIAAAVEGARFEARDAWFAALPHGHPLRAAREAVRDSQVSDEEWPYELSVGWNLLE